LSAIEAIRIQQTKTKCRTPAFRELAVTKLAEGDLFTEISLRGGLALLDKF
jgi:hypothetical protein